MLFFYFCLLISDLQNSRHKLPQVPIGEAAKENMAGEDQTIEYAANAILLSFAVTILLQTDSK